LRCSRHNVLWLNLPNLPAIRLNVPCLGQRASGAHSQRARPRTCFDFPRNIHLCMFANRSWTVFAQTPCPQPRSRIQTGMNALDICWRGLPILQRDAARFGWAKLLAESSASGLDYIAGDAMGNNPRLERPGDSALRRHGGPGQPQGADSRIFSRVSQPRVSGGTLVVTCLGAIRQVCSQ
jgi:hypothetical protein